MTKIVTGLTLSVVLLASMILAGGSALAQKQDKPSLPTEKSFDHTDDVLAAAKEIEDIEFEIMVQRATPSVLAKRTRRLLT
jgi:hypothetical protein